MVCSGVGVVDHLAEDVDDGEVTDDRHIFGLIKADGRLVDAIRPVNGMAVIDAYTVFVLSNRQRSPAVVSELGLRNGFGDHGQVAAITIGTVHIERIANGDVVDIESVFIVAFGELVGILPLKLMVAGRQSE